MQKVDSKVEQLVRDRLDQHKVEQIPYGYKIESEVASSSLLFLPATGGDKNYHVVAIAEISTRFRSSKSQQLDYEAIGQFNAQAVSGIYLADQNALLVKARVSIYAEETAREFIAEEILRAFSIQMSIAYSTMRASQSDEEFRQERAYQEYPRTWVTMPDPRRFSIHLA